MELSFIKWWFGVPISVDIIDGESLTSCWFGRDLGYRNKGPGGSGCIQYRVLLRIAQGYDIARLLGTQGS